MFLPDVCLDSFSLELKAIAEIWPLAMHETARRLKRRKRQRLKLTESYQRLLEMQGVLKQQGEQQHLVSRHCQNDAAPLQCAALGKQCTGLQKGVHARLHAALPDHKYSHSTILAPNLRPIRALCSGNAGMRCQSKGRLCLYSAPDQLDSR